MADAAQPGSFGELLRQHRLDAGLTQAALAERAGLSVRAVQHLEGSFGQPQRETTQRLAEALALTPERRAQFERAATPTPRRRAASRRTGASAGAHGASRDAPAGEILGPRGDLGGERKRVTVLFAEVAGLTESARGFEPDLAESLLTEGVRLLVDVAHRYEGTVNWAQGDGIMALFGAPKAHEDHAVRGCYAALAMHEAIRRYADRVAGERGARVALRVGLDSGEVVVRTASNDLYKEYTALGPAVRGAMRLEQLAGDGVTVLTRETLRLAEGYFHVRPVGPVPAGAPTEAVEAFELTGARPPGSRFQRVASTRQLTRFVGRDTELASLTLPLERARDGHGQIVAVVGEPGVGKSRLVWEAIRSHRTAGWQVLEGGAVSYGMATSYLPVIELLKGYCRIEARDDLPAVREKLSAMVRSLDRALEPDLSALLSLLDVPVEDVAWQALDPPQRRRRTLDAVKRLLLRESQVQPVLLVIEDLHWTDSETQALLDTLVESLPAARILMLVT